MYVKPEKVFINFLSQCVPLHYWCIPIILNSFEYTDLIKTNTTYLQDFL